MTEPTGIISYYNSTSGFSEISLRHPETCQPLIGIYTIEFVTLHVKYLKKLNEDKCVVFATSIFSHFEASSNGPLNRFDPLGIFVLKSGNQGSETILDISKVPRKNFSDKDRFSCWLQSLDRKKIDIHIDCHFFLSRKE